MANRRDEYYDEEDDDPIEGSYEEKEKDILDQITSLSLKLEDLNELKHQLNTSKEIKIEQSKDSIVSNNIKKINNNTKSNEPRIILVTRKLPFSIRKPNHVNTNDIKDSFHKQIKKMFHKNVPIFENEYLNSFSLDETLVNNFCLHSNDSCIWLGCPDTDVQDLSDHTFIQEELNNYNYKPIFLDHKIESLFYAGYCKSVIWPLFHSCPPTNENLASGYDKEFGDEEPDVDKMWEAYKQVNQIFCNEILKIYKEGDLIFIQGYHFTLLPLMIRQQLSNNNNTNHIHPNIGFFMNIPFPSSELFRIITNREDILHGILSSNLVAFQTYEYAKHFQSSCVRLLGLESSHKGVRTAYMNNNNIIGTSHFARIGICPVGINPNKFIDLVNYDIIVQKRVFELIKKFKNKKIILGVDTLDLTKGLVHKFLAIEELFLTQPKLAKDIIFIQVVIPPILSSSCTLSNMNSGHNSPFSSGKNNINIFSCNSPMMSSESHILEAQLEAMVTRINSKVQEIGGETPVHFINNANLTIKDLVSLYCISDILLATPVRDGMNVIPFEYIVCREAQSLLSCVILSEFAGSAASLGGGAILINPWNTTEIKNAILSALFNQKKKNKMIRHHHMYQYVSSFTAQKWADSVIEQLHEAKEDDLSPPVSGKELNMDHIITCYKNSIHNNNNNNNNKRLLFISYEGVLGLNTSIPELAHPFDHTIELLNLLAKDTNNIIVIVSNRAPDIMDNWFHTIPNIILAAEYGTYLKINNKDNKWECLLPSDDDIIQETEDWWNDIYSLLEYYTERTPGSLIEKKRSGITWHYRDCDSDHGFWQASELLMTLREVTHSLPVSIIVPSNNNKMLEIRPHTAITKSELFDKIWQDYNNLDNNINFVFVVASGEDHMDEDLFATLVPPPSALEAYCKEIEKELKTKDDLQLKPKLKSDITNKENIKDNNIVNNNNNNNDKKRIGSAGLLQKLTSSTSANASLGRCASSLDIFISENSKIPSINKNIDITSSKLTNNNNKINTFVSENAVSMFPSSLFISPATIQENISSKSKFTPRKDFPPTAALFQALKKKYGKEFTINKVPNDAATAWALVCPPNARNKVKNNHLNETKDINTNKLLRGPSLSSPSLTTMIDNNTNMKTPTTTSTDNNTINNQFNEINNINDKEKDKEKYNSFIKYPFHTFVCTVGSKLSQAPYFMKKSQDFIKLLKDMTSC